MRTVLNVAMPMITLPFVLNRIGPENYGIYNYVNSIISYFTMAAVLGIPTYASREIARQEGEGIDQSATEIFTIQLISVALASLVFYLGFYPFFAKEHQTVFLILSIQIAGNVFNTEWFYIGRQKFKYIALRSMIIKFLNVLAILLLVRESENCHTYALIIVMTGLATGLVNIRGVIPHLKFRDLNLRRHIRPILVLFALSVTGMINSSIDKTLTGVLVGPLYVGYYSLGFRLTRILQQVFTAMNSIIFPRITKILANGAEKDSDKLHRFSMNYILMLSFPILLGLFLYAEDIILLLFEPELLPAVTSLIILTGTVPVIAVLNVVRQQILLPRDKDRILIYLTIVTTLTNIVFNLLLVPRWQHNGAAAATLMAESAGLVYGLLYASRKFSINLFAWSQLKYLLAAPVLLFPWYMLNPLKDLYPLFLVFAGQLVLSVILFFIMLFLLRDDFFYRYMRKSLQKAKKRIK